MSYFSSKFNAEFKNHILLALNYQEIAKN